MPHVIVKLYPGRSEQQKTRLAEEIVKEVVAIAKCGEESVSVAIEEIQQEDWAEKVYKPDILNKPEKLYKKPGYNPFKVATRMAWHTSARGQITIIAVQFSRQELKLRRCGVGCGSLH